MGSQSLLFLIGIKVLVMMTLLQNILISGALDLLMLIRSKFLIKMTRPQNFVHFYLNVLAWSSLSKILIPSTSGGLRPWNKNALQWGYHNQNFYTYQKQKALLPIWFHIFYNKALLVLSCSIYTPGMFLFGLVTTVRNKFL